jgi:hypothetical protein
MAKKWEIGDIMLCKGELCVLTAIMDTPMGFSQYRIQSLDSGTFQTVNKHELQEIVVEDMDVGSDWDSRIDHLGGVANAGESVSLPVNPERYATMSEEDLDEVAKSRLSGNTESQTRWAVRLFKG